MPIFNSPSRLISVCYLTLLFPSGEPPFQLYFLFLSDSLSADWNEKFKPQQTPRETINKQLSCVLQNVSLKD